MEQTVESPVPICPPHHWIITERQSTSLQDWTCQRCGSIREHQPEVSRLINPSGQRDQEQARLLKQHGQQNSSPIASLPSPPSGRATLFRARRAAVRRAAEPA